MTDLQEQRYSQRKKGFLEFPLDGKGNRSLKKGLLSILKEKANVSNTD